MESSDIPKLKISIVPFVKGADYSSIQYVYVKKESNLAPIQGEMDEREPSPIYAATHIFLDNAIELSKYPSLEYQKEYNDYNWDEQTYIQFLGHFVEAPIAEQGENHIVFFPKVSELFFFKESALQKIPFDEFQKTEPKLAKELINALDPKITESWPLFGIMVCDPTPDWTNQYEALYKGLYQSPREKWKSYLVYNYQFPTEDELKKLKGIVVSGSKLSAYDKVEWFSDFGALLKSIINEQSTTKVYGACFGAQFIAHALGGKVSQMNLKGIPKCMNREKIALKESQIELLNQMSKELSLDKEFLAVECHTDHVEEPPAGAKVIGTSEMTPVEMYEIGKTVLCTQFHPEFNAYYMQKRLFPRLTKLYKPNWSNIDEIIDAHVKQLYTTRCDNAKFNSFLKKWLKS